MLTVNIPETELFDESTGEFTTLKQKTIRLEHSLVSISKWESKFNKPFIIDDNSARTDAETLSYIQCMTITQNVKPIYYNYIPPEELSKITAYIEEPMTATTFNDTQGGSGKQVITSEVIYYWMVAHNIPFECQKWHLNRLLTLIRVCNLKNAPKKKMSSAELRRRNRNLNKARRERMNTRG